jgi:hypothetical protein
MATVLHHEIHLPTAVEPTVHWLERMGGAFFLTILAPVAFAILIVSGLLLAIGVSTVL